MPPCACAQSTTWQLEIHARCRVAPQDAKGYSDVPFVRSYHTNAPNCLTMAGSLRHNGCVAGGRWQVARIGATISNVMMFTCYANTINSALWAIFVLQIEMPTDMLTQLHHVDCQGGNPFMCVCVCVGTVADNAENSVYGKVCAACMHR